MSKEGVVTVADELALSLTVALGVIDKAGIMWMGAPRAEKALSRHVATLRSSAKGDEG